MAFVAAALWWSWRESKATAVILGTGVAAFLGAIAKEELGKAPLRYTRVEGIVRAAESGAPIAGAHVLILWETGHGYARNACTWLAVAHTDDTGRYAIRVDASRMRGIVEATKEEMTGGFPTVRIYKEGRQSAHVERIEDDAEQVRRRLGPFPLLGPPGEFTIRYHDTMAPAGTDSGERMKTLLALSHPEPGCRTYDDRDAIKAYFEAIAREARKIARSEDDGAYAQIIVARAAIPVGPGAEANLDASLPVKVIKTH